MSERVLRRISTSVLIFGLAALGACSSETDESTKDTRKATTTSAAQADEAAADAGDFCAQFAALAEQREEKGAGNVQPGSTEAVPEGEAGWDQRIQTTSELAAAAPEEYQEEAATYVELVTARAELFAEHGYPSSLAEIPAEATQAFIQDHIDEQQVANTFIAFAKTECGVA